MRTFHDFWLHPTPEDDTLRRAALDSVARAQGEDFATWPEFTAWDLGPGGAGMSRALFDLVGNVFEGVHPHIEELRLKATTWADIAGQVMPSPETLIRSTLREATQGIAARMRPEWRETFEADYPDLNELSPLDLRGAYQYAVSIMRHHHDEESTT